MKALTWHGKGDVRCENVPDPRIEHPRDAIIKVTSCAICGSDLHIYDGVIPSMESGDVLGHETMGQVVEVGSENRKLKVGDRVVVPFTISCGECFFCKRGYYSGCERSNPNREKAEKLYDRIQELTHGRGADACIDAVGTEPHTTASFDSVVDRMKVATFMGTDRPHVLRQAIHCCRNFGTVSIVGVYGGFLDKIPMGSAINRGLTFRMAQTPVQHYLPSLLERIEKGEINPSFVITHRAPLVDGPELYKTFRDKQDGCVKVVLQPA
jgi:threonine dehydrogenase-like Zn-dependent dehydrogenase